MIRYCRHCGHHLNVNYGEESIYCPLCDKEIAFKETIAGHTIDARMSQLKAMHDLMCEANDEYIYMAWINLMPDCPSMEDIRDIAMNDKLYNECFDLFVKLIAKDGNRY
jgi:hypothetical protein